MIEYVKTYIQKASVTNSDGLVIRTYPVKETIEDFGIYCKDIPFKMYGEAKDFSKTDFHDEDGVECYFPAVLKMKDYEIEIEFAYKGAKNSANAAIKNFLDYLTGKDGTGTSLSIYNTYTRIGRQHIRFLSIDDEVTFYRDYQGTDEDLLIFKIKFNVCDPTTEITLSK